MAHGLHWDEADYAAYLRRRGTLQTSEPSPPTQETDDDLPEAQFMAQVLACAKRLGWLCYHTHDSRRSPEGFPDLVLVGGSGVIFAELKTRTGKLTREQALWLEMLKHAGQECYIWRSDDLPSIQGRLAKG